MAYLRRKSVWIEYDWVEGTLLRVSCGPRTHVEEENWMLDIERKEPCDEECLTLGAQAWRVHHLRIDLLTCVQLGEKALHLETLSCRLDYVAYGLSPPLISLSSLTYSI
jgi:hypothetical protein